MLWSSIKFVNLIMSSDFITLRFIINILILFNSLFNIPLSPLHWLITKFKFSLDNWRLSSFKKLYAILNNVSSVSGKKAIDTHFSLFSISDLSFDFLSKFSESIIITRSFKFF